MQMRLSAKAPTNKNTQAETIRRVQLPADLFLNQLSRLEAGLTFPVRGRATNSPPQFGQIAFMEFVQSPQKVHS